MIRNSFAENEKVVFRPPQLLWVVKYFFDLDESIKKGPRQGRVFSRTCPTHAIIHTFWRIAFYVIDEQDGGGGWGRMIAFHQFSQHLSAPPLLL